MKRNGHSTLGEGRRKNLEMFLLRKRWLYLNLWIQIWWNLKKMCVSLYSILQYPTVSFKSYKKQQKFCSRLYNKKRKKYYNLMDFKNKDFINYNRRFWKTVKPFLLDNGWQCSQINLADQDNVISADKNLVTSLIRQWKI